MDTKFLTDFLWLFSVLAGLAIEEVLKNSYSEFTKAAPDPMHYLMLAAFLFCLVAFHISNLTYYRFVHESNDGKFNGARFLFDYGVHLLEYMLLFWMAELLAHSDAVNFTLFFTMLYLLDYGWVKGGMALKFPSHICAKHWMDTSKTVVGGILFLWFARWGVPHLPKLTCSSAQLTPWCIAAALLLVIAVSIVDIWRTYRFYLRGNRPTETQESTPRTLVKAPSGPLPSM